MDWFDIAKKLLPSRCREVPLATDPSRILLRQCALWKKRVYLQQFMCSEEQGWFHSHPWRRGTIAIGLRGELYETRLGGPVQGFRWKAPYFRIMGPNFYHRSFLPRNHLSIFIGLGEKTDDKFYVPVKARVRWSDRIKKVVARL